MDSGDVAGGAGVDGSRTAATNVCCCPAASGRTAARVGWGGVGAMWSTGVKVTCGGAGDTGPAGATSASGGCWLARVVGGNVGSGMPTVSWWRPVCPEVTGGSYQSSAPCHSTLQPRSNKAIASGRSGSRAARCAFVRQSLVRVPCPFRAATTWLRAAAEEHVTLYLPRLPGVFEGYCMTSTMWCPGKSCPSMVVQWATSWPT